MYAKYAKGSCSRRGLARFLALWVLLTVFSVGASASHGADQPTRGGRFIQVLPGEPGALNPSLGTDTNMYSVAGAIFSTLVQFDKKLRPVPDLAETWNISPDGLTYTFKLRDAKWHDGRPVTSEDVKFTMSELTAKYQPRGSVIAKAIGRIDTPDARTVIFRLKQPSPAFIFINRLANGGAILPKHIYEGTDPKTNPANTKPIGSGPFRFKEWVKGSHIAVERNPNYFKPGLPYLDSVIFQVIPDPTGRIGALQRGEVDYLGYATVAYSEVTRLKQSSEVVVSTEGNEGIGALTLIKINQRHPILQHRAVRQALAYGLDTQAVVQRAHYGIGRPATGPLHSDIAWAYTAQVQRYGHDPRKAEQALDQAGYPRKADGTRFKISLVYPPSSQELTKTAEVARDNWMAIGVRLDLVPQDVTTLNKTEADWNYDLHLNWYSTGPDPAIGVERQYTTENIKHSAAVNTMGYSNPHMDALFRQAAVVTDQAPRARAYYEIQKILATDLPVLFVYEWALPLVYRSEWANVCTLTFCSDQRLEEVYKGGSSQGKRGQ